MAGERLIPPVLVRVGPVEVTAFIQDNSQPVPMSEKDRAALLRRLFGVSGW